MKKFIKYIALSATVLMLINSCDKKDSVSVAANGTAVTVSSSTNTIAAAAADSLKTVLTISWSNPKYATDSATEKYVIQFDTSGANFSQVNSYTVYGSLAASFTAQQLNTILQSYYARLGVPHNLDIRVISSYANNNQALTSNVITVAVTPYGVPSVLPPTSSGSLFIVGDATDGGWNNPVPVPSQQFTKIDSLWYTGTFNMTGGKQYLFLPVNGDWTNKYAVDNSSLPHLSSGGDFGYDLSSNFPGPDSSGVYKIVASFQYGKFFVSKQ